MYRGCGKIEELLCIGLNSQTKDGKHILLMDFDIDKDKLPLLEDNLRYTINSFNLSDIYLINTPNGFNAFCLDKFDFGELFDIMESLTYIDRKFFHIGIEKQYYTLTMNYEKTYIGMISSRYKTRQKSNAHYNFFKYFMYYPMLKHLKNFDKHNYISISFYFSNKHGVKLTGDINGNTYTG